MNKQQLIFVYNANSDLFSTVTDFAHKIFSPSNYECHLCALTFGNFAMKQEWKSFIADLPVDAIFLHKDEFEEQYKMETNLPTVYYQNAANGTIKQIITKQEIDSCKTLEQLKNTVTIKLKEHVQHYHSNVQ